MIGPVTCRLFFAIFLVAAAQAVGQDIQPLSEVAEATQSPALSPDGTTLVFTWTKPDYSSGLFLRPIRGSETTAFAATDENATIPAYPTYPRWSPDGKQIAFLRMSCNQCAALISIKGYPEGDEIELGEACKTPPLMDARSRHLDRIGARKRTRRLPYCAHSDRRQTAHQSYRSRRRYRCRIT